ncbi:hypothetical protein ILUMI_00149, partial [Ignelater luminosus]
TIILLVANGEFKVRQQLLVQVLCLLFPFQLRICEALVGLISRTHFEQSDPETLPIQLLQDPDNTSAKVLAHYGQMIMSHKFRRYDYGFLENVRNYNSFTPPLYNLTKIKIPVYLIAGRGDILARPENVITLHKALSNEANRFPIFFVDNDKFTHMDFLWAKDVVPLCYEHVLNFINSNYHVLP